ncbi:predicted protein [Chaetomium globosum CBS 148.51]|uniref:Uncharacterized protein n=1 Tax=Chaetomium globosum (strain ATCC 6205 / CBS 148.51 / DSM 1962 / NBRC 6347 / NRRL 1970) TaxID=306901 RepID=Q2H188_CHAGB|nr:uncharacterized protein CHGG_04458 [Chaetomium globosum CBS 148.51]EAQ87839.1 predicted protein [Chaetomium globosum CBS 148.51]
MTSKSVFVVGANRGIGFNLVKAFIAESWEVTGTVRPQTCADKDPTVAEKTGAKILELDYLDEETIEKAAAAYGDKPLDMLVDLGGLPPKPGHWHEQTAEVMVEKFRIMTAGPIITTEHFLPKLESATDAKIVNVSSAFGSVSSVVTKAFEWEPEGPQGPLICVEPGFPSTRLTGWDGEDDMDTWIARLMKVSRKSRRRIMRLSFL